MRSKNRCGDGDPFSSGRSNLVSFSDYLNSANDGELSSEPQPLRVLAVLKNGDPDQRVLDWLVTLGRMVPALEVVLVQAGLPQSSGLSQQSRIVDPEQFQDRANRKLASVGIPCESE